MLGSALEPRLEIIRDVAKIKSKSTFLLLKKKILSEKKIKNFNFFERIFDIK